MQIKINGVDVSLDEINYFIKRHMYSGAKSFIVRKTNCSPQEAEEIVQELILTNQQQNTDVRPHISPTTDGKDTVKCPRCGSTQITTGMRGWKITTGFLGSSKTVNRCAKCGYTWTPSYWTRNRWKDYFICRALLCFFLLRNKIDALLLVLDHFA